MRRIIFHVLVLIKLLCLMKSKEKYYKCQYYKIIVDIIDIKFSSKVKKNFLFRKLITNSLGT